ncbi:putative bifunctional diguanylate cyclase/phosphodiesterase [Clostridium sp. B9]
MKKSVLKRRVNLVIISVFILWIIISTAITLFKLYPQVYTLQKEGNRKAINNMIEDFDREIGKLDNLMFRNSVYEKYNNFLNEKQFNIRGFIDVRSGKTNIKTSNGGELYLDSFKDVFNTIINVYNYDGNITVGTLKEKIPFLLFLNKVDKNLYQVGVVFLDGKGSFRLDQNLIGQNVKVSFFPINADTSSFEEMNIESGFLGDIYKKSYISDKSFINDVYLKDYKDDICLELVYDFDIYGSPYVYEAFIKYGLSVLIINIIFAIIIITVLNRSIFFRIDVLNNKVVKMMKAHGIKYKELNKRSATILKEDEITAISKDLGVVNDYIDFYAKRADFYYKKDKATGLNKMDTFLSQGKVFIKENKKSAIIYISLEGISVLNYNLGFNKGTKLMKCAVLALNKVMPHGIWARISGIELAILFKYDREEELEEYCKKVIYELNNNIYLDNKQYFISCSVGGTLISDTCSSLDCILSRAYIAMTMARENAINTYEILNNEINNSITVDMLQDAMENNEFKLYYQPKVDCKTLEIVGVEALIRWISPEKGFIPPDEFISIAEKSGYIRDLGKWVLKEAAKDMNEFREKTGKDLSIGINVSAIQLLDSELINDIKYIFDEVNYPLDKVELEITESMSVNRFNGLKKMIESARSLGMSIAIDDFGTGYSNLKYLKDYEVDTIKLDKSLIENMKDNKMFIKSVIDIIRIMGAQSVAEGVEEVQEVELLRKYGCNLIQGYYFYKPMPLESLIETIKNI